MTSIAPRRSPEKQAALDARDRRQFRIVAVIFTACISILTIFYVVVNDISSPPTPTAGAVQQEQEPSFDVPDGGSKPTNSGDRGGSEQLILMTGLMVVLIGGAAYVVHSSRRVRKRSVNENESDETPIEPAKSAT